MAERILIIGSNGQIGTELLLALRNQFGPDAVVASDLRFSQPMSGPHAVLDAMDAQAANGFGTRRRDFSATDTWTERPG